MLKWVITWLHVFQPQTSCWFFIFYRLRMTKNPKMSNLTLMENIFLESFFWVSILFIREFYPRFDSWWVTNNLSCLVSLKITKVLYEKISTIQTWKISNSSSFIMTMKNVSILDKFITTCSWVFKGSFIIPILLSTDWLKISHLILCHL